MQIRDVEQLKQRFQYFASALQFTIMAEDQYVSHRFVSSSLSNI